MLINIKDFKADVNEISLNFSQNIQDVNDFPDVVKFLSPVSFTGKVEKTDDFYTVTGKIHTDVCMNCVLCLEPVDISIDCDFFQKYANVDTKEDETEFFQGDCIDIFKALKDTIICEIPMKVLCREDCKGLCLKCGKNLNEGECGCDRASLDPRMSAIRDIFNNFKEV